MPAPVLTGLAVFLLSVGAYGLVMTRRRRSAAGGLLAGVATFALVLGFAAPIPTSIQDLREDPRLAFHHGNHAQLATAAEQRPTLSPWPDRHPRRPQSVETSRSLTLAFNLA